MAPHRIVCLRVAASAPSELAWIVDLLAQSAAYAVPALAELDRSLLPGVAGLRPRVKERLTFLWRDGLSGCPELIALAAAGGCLDDGDAGRLVRFLSTLPRQARSAPSLLSEPRRSRSLVRRRLARLDTDIATRRAYRDVLEEVWELVAPVWERRGRATAAASCADWKRKLSGVTSASAVVHLMPPRHPLAVSSHGGSALIRRRSRFTLAPMFFCMSGGHVVDLDDQLHIGVPASALEPVRRSRDAAFVADRARVFAEPTRMRVLIHLLSQPAGVMELTRALGMSQPSISEHVRVLAAAELIRGRRKGSRTVYVPSVRRVDRLLEDARATLARWSDPRRG